MMLYPRTPHVPREPKLMMDIAPRMIDGFDQHLGRSSKASPDWAASGSGEPGL